MQNKNLLQKSQKLKLNFLQIKVHDKLPEFYSHPVSPRMQIKKKFLGEGSSIFLWFRSILS